jgi:CRP-like cAMP-binding protein
MRSSIRKVDLRRLRRAGSEVCVAAGQLLTERGHHGSGLYVIVEGSVLVEAPERSRVLGPGSCIGERALLRPNGRRTARVQARTNVRAIAVPRADFEALCVDEPELGSRLAAAAAA